MSSELAALMLPAIRWDAEQGYEPERERIQRALEIGVGGFILFGGNHAAAHELTAALRARSTQPLLIGADLERGTGQQFEGATGLPPLAAIASLNDPRLIRRAAQITAREAAALGVNWAFAPVCDLDIEPDNPIIGTRAFGGDPARVAEYAAEWVDACQAEGVLASAKHFPGHGRTRTDSHAELPVVAADIDELYGLDLAPFRAAIDAGVASVMTAHVSYPALDPAGVPATLSPRIAGKLLREELGFEGLVVTDALIMAGVLGAGGGSEEACVRALEAGCDLLLYPESPVKVVSAMERALDSGQLDMERLRASLQRRARWAEWAGGARDSGHERDDPGHRGSPTQVNGNGSDPGSRRSMEEGWKDNRAWADAIADRLVHVVAGDPVRTTPPLDVVIIDDDEGGPYPPPSREPFLGELRAYTGGDMRVLSSPSGDGRRSVVVALFGDIRAWKGRPGYSAAALEAVRSSCVQAPSATVMQFGHPRLAGSLAGAHNVVSAWGGEQVMQRAAARWLMERGA